MARFATEEYEIGQSSYQNVFKHLTNYAINKLHENYKVSEEVHLDIGHKRLQSVVFQRMKSNGVDTDRLTSE